MADPPKHFFKFIPPAFNHNLSIPISFLPNLINGGRCLKAILRRGGHEWPVDVTDGGFSGEGWRKCFRENVVQGFDFLVFKHQGNMVFDFWVFDPSTCERNFPNIPDGKEPLTESDSVIHTNRSRKIRKRKKNDFACENEENIRLGDDLCFIKKMTPYSIKTSRLHVPVNFVRSNGLITERIHRQVNIRDETRRIWPATLHKNREIKFYSVWREFKVKNHLKEGDNCMFEFVKGGDVPILNFYNLGKKANMKHTPVKKTNSTIKKPYRAFHGAIELKEEETFKNCNQINSHKNAKLKEVATPREEDHHPCFVGELKSYSIKQSLLHIPIKFAKENGLFNGREMILINVEDERSWTVEVKSFVNKCCYITRGWKDFRVANGLKEGDLFKLEIVDKTREKIIANFYCQKIR